MCSWDSVASVNAHGPPYTQRLSYGECSLFRMVIFHIKHIKNLNLYLSTGLLTTALAGVFALATPVIVLGADMVARTADAVLISVTNASGSNLIVPLLALSWFIFSVCKFLICYYAFVLSASHWARLSDYKPLIFPAGALIMVYSIIAYSNTIEEAEFAKRIWTVYAIPFDYGHTVGLVDRYVGVSQSKC